MQQDYKTLAIYVLTLFVVILLIVLKKQQDHLSDLESGFMPEEEIEMVLDSLDKEPIKEETSVDINVPMPVWINDLEQELKLLTVRICGIETTCY